MRDKGNRRPLAILVGLLLSAPVMAAPLTDEAAMQLLQRLNQMEQEVSNLRGENEQLRNEVQSLQKAQKEGFQQVDEKIDKIKSESTRGAGSDATPTPLSNTQPLSNSAAVDKSSEKMDSGSKSDEASNKDPNSYYSYGTNKTDDKNLTKPTDAKTDSKPSDSNASTDGSKTDASKTSTDSSKTDTAKAGTDKDKPLPAKEERSVYDEAFNTLLKKPKDSIPLFRAFLKDYPNSPLASSAQYWIGEALYAEKDYKAAADEFLVVLKDYKGSDKAPGAALKLGYSFYELKEWEKARKTLEDVIAFFPDEAETVQKAQERLDRMKSEGH